MLDSTLIIKRTDQYAKIPSLGSTTAAGMDIYSLNDTIIPANHK